MKSSFWTPYISDHTIHAICWTLIHSLWIGLAIALIAGLVITATRKSAAALRYNLLCGILVLFTASVWVTFWLEMRSYAIGQGSSHIGQFIFAPDNVIIIAPSGTTPHLSLFTRIVWLLNEYANVIFLAWLLLFVLKSLKMAGGLLYIQRIRNYKVHEVSEEFKHKIEVFAGQIGIRQAVRLVQSELVKVPVAVGWLKPMILLPMGILLQLSPEQLESILWHELAHIRRRDYLVNILQGLVETVFFFNPGLLWLSSLIRSEREACCDDIVLSRMNRKANYLEALLAFGNEDNSRMPLAMSIGSGNELRDRLKRMVNKENKRLNMAEKVVLIAGLVVLSAFTTMPKITQNAVKHLVDVMIKKPRHADTLKFKTKMLDSATKQTREFQQTEVISSDTVHGKRNILAPFKSVLFKNSDADLANNDISAEDTTGKKYHFIVADNKLVAMEVNGEKVQESDLPKYQYLVTQIDVAVLEKRHIRETDLARFKANSPAAKFKADQFKMRYNDSLKFKPSAKFKADQYKMRYADSLGFKPTAKFKSDQYKMLYIDSLRRKSLNNNDAINLKEEAMRQRWRDDSASYAVQKNRALSVIADLVHDKAVPDPASVKWFGLSDTEFIVNGQKQPDELQQKYKAKYGIYEGNGLYYGPVQMHGVGVFIDADSSRPPLPPGSPRPPKAMHEQRSGYMQPKYVDTNGWKLRQLIKQQQMFAADEAKQRAKLMDEQQHFVAQENKKRQQLVHQQEIFTADQARKQNFALRSNALQGVLRDIANDLVSDNIVKDQSDIVGFMLTNRSLIVNGKTQPEDIHQKLKDKYLSANGQYPAAKLLIDSELEQQNKQFIEDPNFGFHYDTKDGSLSMGVGISSGN